MYVVETVPSITIDLKPGAYILGNESGAGKSYLAYALDQARRAGFHRVISVTKSDLDLGLDLNSLVNKEFDVIMLDRFDLYEGPIAHELTKYHPNGWVLLDCKRGFGPWMWDVNFEVELAEVEFNAMEIRVF